jgi:predicted acetyltransferase
MGDNNMNELKLVLSSSIYKEQYMELLQDCKDDIRNRGFEYCIPISTNASFENDIQKLLDQHAGKGLPEGWVPASVYWLINDMGDKIIGVITIRHSLSANLYFRGGHISYYIRPSERKKGYATKMLTLALEKCSELGIERVMITCAKDNIGSMKTILNNGGILHSEDVEDDEAFQRYWIDLYQ